MGRSRRHLQPLHRQPCQPHARKRPLPAQPLVNAPTVAAATAAAVGVATALKDVQKVAQKDVATVVRTPDQKVVQKARAAMSAANAIPKVAQKDVPKASARTAP